MDGETGFRRELKALINRRWAEEPTLARVLINVIIAMEQPSTPATPGDARTRASAAATAIAEDRRPLPPDVLAGTLQDAVETCVCPIPRLWCPNCKHDCRACNDARMRALSGTAVGGTAVCGAACCYPGEQQCAAPCVESPNHVGGCRCERHSPARAPSLEVAPPPGEVLLCMACNEGRPEDCSGWCGRAASPPVEPGTPPVEGSR